MNIVSTIHGEDESQTRLRTYAGAARPMLSRLLSKDLLGTLFHTDHRSNSNGSLVGRRQLPLPALRIIRNVPGDSEICHTIKHFLPCLALYVNTTARARKNDCEDEAVRSNKQKMGHSGVDCEAISADPPRLVLFVLDVVFLKQRALRLHTADWIKSETLSSLWNASPVKGRSVGVQRMICKREYVCIARRSRSHGS